MAGFAIADGRWDFAAAIVTAFNGFCRPSELLFAARDCVFDFTRGVVIVNLGLTKGGKRAGAPEQVAIDDDVAFALLERQLHGKPAGTALLPRGLQEFRAAFKHYVNVCGFDPSVYKPYSIRRGGATHHFRMAGNLSATTERGRWRSKATAKIYITEGVALVADAAITPRQRAQLDRGRELLIKHAMALSRQRG